MVLLSALLFLAGCGDRPEGQHRWDMSLPWSTKEFHTQNAMRFAQLVEEQTAGRVTIRVHPGGALGIKGPGALRALSEGVVHMTEIPGVQQIGSAPLLALESLPFLVRDMEELRRLDALVRPHVAEELRRRGVHLLYRVPWPNQNLFFKRPVASLAQMEGLRIRTYDRLTGELMDRLGMQPVQLALGDVVPALASGAVDATMTSTSSANAQRYWEFMSHIFRSNHTWLVNLMAVEADAWARLSPDLQQAVTSAAQSLEASFWAVAAADDQAKLAILEAEGMTVLEPSPEVLAAMEAAARPMWDQFAEAAGPQAQQILAQFLAERP